MPENRFVNVLNALINFVANRFVVLFLMAYYSVLLYFGNTFSKTLQHSPLLKIIGKVLSFFLIIIGILISCIYYLITGELNFTNDLIDLLPAGARYFSVVIGFLAVIMVIGYFTKKLVERIENNTIRLVCSAISIVIMGIFITRTYLSVNYEYFILYCIAGLLFSLIFNSRRNN